MIRKAYQGASNDKSKSTSKLVEAVGVIIREKGYRHLTATNIAKAAGLDRRLITLYFGTIDNLIETYIRGKDYWIAATGDISSIMNKNEGENTQEILDHILQQQLKYFSENEEMQKIVLWQISESTQLMKEITEQRELMSQSFFKLADQELDGRNIDLRAISALLVAGIYYLVLHTKSTDVTFCEIDLRTSSGMDRIHKAISQILKNTYADKAI